MAQSAILSDTAFELDGYLSELGRLVEQVDRFCQAEDLDGDAAFELNLVLEELFTNVVRHGGCEGMKNAVAVRLQTVDEGEVSVVFRDRGTPFDPTSAAPPDIAASLAEREPGRTGNPPGPPDHARPGIPARR